MQTISGDLRILIEQLQASFIDETAQICLGDFQFFANLQFLGVMSNGMLSEK